MSETLLDKLMDKIDDHELLLLIAVEGDDYLYEYIDVYELYGNYLMKFYKLCNYDYETVKRSFHLIASRPYITKDIVKTNLDFDEPVPFLNNSYLNSGFMPEIAAVMNVLNFTQEYEEKLSQQNLNKRKK